MNNLTLFFLGLVLICVPACNGKQCFSKNLKPSYPCCNGKKVVYTDENGDWGIEKGRWCGIGNGSCFSTAYGYPCCKSCKVLYTDKYGKWGVENRNWCGIKDSCFAAEKQPVQEVEEPVQVDSDFEFSFLKLENNKKNMLYSPLSIEYALNMLQEGAVNNTYAEINKLIANRQLSKYSSIDKNLSFANGLFIRDFYYDGIKTDYIKTLIEKYNAEVEKDEFEDAKNVNGWIEDKTLGIIKDMIDDSLVQNPNLVMLIINALAIDMEWAYQFNCDKTRGETFYLDNGKEMTTTMMFNKEVQSESIAYYKDDSVTALTMDLKKYDEIQLEFMAIMPEGDLSAFVENVSKEQIEHIDKNLKLSLDEDYGVNVKIPKFKFNYDLELKNDLKKLGVNDAFDDKMANFSKMSDIHLYVSHALHKADIDFSEEGVKAAAVTVFAMMTKSAPIPKETYPVNIEINKPFMFVIRDKNTKDIWFTGTVYQPNSWDNDQADYEPKFNF